MILLKSTVCLLLIIALAEAQSIHCFNDCKPGATVEGEEINVTCMGTASGLTWHNNNDKSLLQLSHPPISVRGSFIAKAKAEAPDGNPWYCSGRDFNDKELYCTVLPCKVLYVTGRETTKAGRSGSGTVCAFGASFGTGFFVAIVFAFFHLPS
jgi:hypothetical protein